MRSAPGSKPFVPGKIGAHWQIDKKKFSGKDSHPIIGLNGCTHTLSGIDHASGRVFGYPTQENVKVITHVKWLWQTNHDNGYIMETLSADPEFKTKAVAKFLQSCQPPVKLLVSITDEHFGIREIERCHNNIHESMTKIAVSETAIDPNMWLLVYEADLDMYNQLPTARHHHKAPYQTYDPVKIDLDATPTFPIGTVVVGHIPLNKQSAIRPGRGIELIAIGRSQFGFGGAKFYNPRTGKIIYRRTIKFIGDHPAKWFTFSSPPFTDVTPETDDTDIISDIPLPGHSYSGSLPSHSAASNTDVPDLIDDTTDDDEDDDNEIIYPGLGGRQKAAIRDTMNIDEMLSPPITPLLYEPIQKDKVHPSQRRYFAKVGSMFTEHMAVHVDVLYKIHAIVKSKECANRQLYYQYFLNRVYLSLR